MWNEHQQSDQAAMLKTQLAFTGCCLPAHVVGTGSLMELFLLRGENDDVSQIFFQFIPSYLQVSKVLFL